MKTLKIEKFSPKKSELVELSKKYRGLVINGIDDVSGYSEVDNARKDLKRKRREIQITGKDMRSEAVAFQKEVIKLEGELVQIIEPLERGLKGKQDIINEEKLKVERLKELPKRKEDLSKLGEIKIDDDSLLSMSNDEFTAFYNTENTKILEKKQQELEEKQKKIIEQEQELQREKELKETLEKARKQVRKEEIEKAKKEKQEIIDQQQQREKELEEAEKVANQKKEDEKTRLEEMGRYQKFLLENNYSAKNEHSFYIDDLGDEVVLYKKVAVFKKR